MNDGIHGNSRTALVAFGSETGTASDYAEELGRMLERIHFSIQVSILDSIDPASFVDLLPARHSVLITFRHHSHLLVSLSSSLLRLAKVNCLKMQDCFGDLCFAKGCRLPISVI